MEHATKFYYTSTDAPPRDLPTRNEITSSVEIMCDQSCRKVVGVGQYFVVKYGLQVDLGEGQVMLHVAKNTSMSVPRVYALYQDPEDRRNYIVMERVQGSTLEHLWPSLNDVQKEIVSAKLKAGLDEMRTLPSPGSFCSLSKGPLPDALFCTSDCTAQFHQDGPFEREEDLNSSLIRRYSSSEGLPQGKARFYRRALPSIFCGHLPVFTHGNFQKKNIMVKVKAPDAPDAPDAPGPEFTSGLEVFLVDWETAGWYLSYWEYARAMFACGRFDDDWDCWIDRILKPYLNEYAWMYTIMIELWS